MLWHEPSQCDLLFVTLNKGEALFSPSTRYRDLALGASTTGQRYIHHEARGSRVLLFVREHRREGGRSTGHTEPFRCLGFARYESHEGERPMAIRWRLERAIPAGWLQGMALAVSVLVHAHSTRQAWSAHASRRTAAVGPPAP